MAEPRKSEAQLKKEMERIKRQAEVERLSRNQESMNSEEIHESYSDEWRPKGILDSSRIPPRPGYAQRWVRTMTSGNSDQTNVIRQFNAGWNPRRSDTIPKGEIAPTREFQGANVVGVDGMILCERPLEKHNSQGTYIKSIVQRQIQASDESVFKDKNINVSRKTKSTFRKPSIMDD